MIAYLDTNVVLWLAAQDLGRITSRALEVVRQADLLLAPMVVLELQYLFETGKVAQPAKSILIKIGHEVDARVCDLAFPLVLDAALDENWTREPF